ncbi:hypothetical protein H5410_048522 [Solanum commersonii]|uniref:C2H2-type domain-containing protein n=1 Tax=Solanum commersonii TaxID=4109 RepID=A0A9J5XM09_SOLCO|nr:hypothetical protein H5410_048522 [Solanum commersonii]
MEKSSSKYFNKHQTMKNVKEYSWDNNYVDHQGGDLVGGFLWPPRSYTCSFCKREFKSAQALGGGGSHEMKNGDLTKMGCAKFEENGKECSEVVKRSEF